MAVDEALFRSAQRTPGAPVLRFYGWRRPAVTLGRFQRKDMEIDEAFCLREGIDVVVRPTGGKAVYHDRDLTYAVVASDASPLFPRDILGTYEIIGRCLQEGLREMGVPAVFAEGPRPGVGGGGAPSCFSCASRFELLAEGKKICGSAQVRSRGVFLQHGSILVSFDPFKACAAIGRQDDGALPRAERVRRLREAATSVDDHVPLGKEGHRELISAIQRSFARRLGAVFEEGTLTPEEEALKRDLLRDRLRFNGPPGTG